MRDIFGYPYIDGSVWALEIIVKYYIFAAIIWYFWRHRFLEAMCIALVLLCFFGYALHEWGWLADSPYEYLDYVLNKQIKYSLLITLGLCFYTHYKKVHSILKPLGFGLLLLAAFASPLSVFPRSAELMQTYYLGVLLFGCSVLFTNIGQKRTGYGSMATQWVAEISYPLYVGHVLPGYTIMYYLLERDINVYFAIFLALCVSFLIAYVVHEKVEKVFRGIKTEGTKREA